MRLLSFKPPMKYRSLALSLSPVLLTACQSSPAEEPIPETAVESETGEAQTQVHFLGADRIEDGLTHLQPGFESDGARPMKRIDGTLIGPDARPLVGEYIVMFSADVETAPNVSQSSAGSFKITTDENGRFVHELEHGFGPDLSKPTRFVFALTSSDERVHFSPGGLYPDPDVMLVAHFLHRPVPEAPGEEVGYALQLERVQTGALEAALTVDSRQIDGVFTLHFIPGKDLGFELPWGVSNTMVGLGGGGEEVLYSTPGAEGWQLRAVTENHGVIDLPHAAPGDTVVIAP